MLTPIKNKLRKSEMVSSEKHYEEMYSTGTIYSKYLRANKQLDN